MRRGEGRGGKGEGNIKRRVGGETGGRPRCRLGGDLAGTRGG